MNNDLEQVAVIRDLVRRPEIKTLAFVLAKINVTGPVDKDNIPPIWVTMAHRLLNNKAKRDLLLTTVEALANE